MSGFLDANAPSVDVEYSRYLDGDILGKLIAKNFLRNRIGYQHDHIVIPVGRHGDARSKYAQAGKVDRDAADGRVKTKKEDVTVEIKCARINIANQCNGRELENWAFGDILLSPTKKQKKYDVLIAIGLRTLGLENGRYWAHLKALLSHRSENVQNAILKAKPHEVRFLTLCSFFVIPMREIQTDYFRLHLGAVEKSHYAQYRAWGHDVGRCKEVWRNALKAAQRR